MERKTGTRGEVDEKTRGEREGAAKGARGSSEWVNRSEGVRV